MRWITLILSALAASGVAFAAPGDANLFRQGKAVAPGEGDVRALALVNDGVASRRSSWVSPAGMKAPFTLEIRLPRYARIDSLVIKTGIPEDEMLPSERGRAAGYWGMKNFILQYWDDANWTDIPGTYRTENRLDDVCLPLGRAVNAYRFRIVSTDADPIRIREFEGYGTWDESLTVPSGSLQEGGLSRRGAGDGLHFKILPETSGRSLQYVAFNQGTFVPGDNTRLWWEYSQVNGARIWTSLSSYAQEQWFSDDFPPVRSLSDFERNKKAFLADTERFCHLDKIAQEAARTYGASNTMSLDYCLHELRDLGIDIVSQGSIERAYYEVDWQRKWNLWQRWYALASYLYREGHVTLFAMINEPNHRNAGPMPLSSWVELSKVVSDAVHAAVPGGRFVGPVTAGNNEDWWRTVAATDHTDYRGAYTDAPVIDVFSTHSYNVPAVGYKGRVTRIRDILGQAGDGSGASKPVVFTETGLWMNAYLIDKPETMDSPSLCAEWAGMYANNMAEGCYGMWAFKFANTITNVYPWGVKSGHHLVWRGTRFTEDEFENLALGRQVTLSWPGGDGRLVTDGDKGTGCVLDGGGSATVRFPRPVRLGGLAVYTGSDGGIYTAPDRSRDMDVDYLSGEGEWVTLPKAAPGINKYAQVYYVIDEAVTTEAVRVRIRDQERTILREVLAFGPGTLSGAQTCYDVGGAHRAAEVVRLFAKGFRGGRPLHVVTGDTFDDAVNVCACRDSIEGMKYVWLVNRHGDERTFALDLSGLGVPGNRRMVAEEVSARSCGEASVLVADGEGRLSVPMAPKGVVLLSIPEAGSGLVHHEPLSCVCVGMDGRRAGNRAPCVMKAPKGSPDNRVVYLGSADVSEKVAGAGRVLLSFETSSAPGDSVRIHVYGFTGQGVSRRMRWKDAPHLDPDESRFAGYGPETFIAGQVLATGARQSHCLDVTEALRRRLSDGKVTFLLVREAREYGDDRDNYKKVAVAPSNAELTIW